MAYIVTGWTMWSRNKQRCIKYGIDAPPNGLRFSCRRGAPHRMPSKKHRSRAPKAVSCKRLFGGNRGWIIL